MEDLNGIVTDLLRANKTLKIATAGGPVSPWVGGAFFAERDPFTLQVVLETHGKAYTNIRANNRIAVIIAGDHPFAPFLQGEGSAHVVADSDADRVKDDLLAKNPEMEPFFAMPLERVHLRIDRWLVTDVPKGWLPAKELRAG